MKRAMVSVLVGVITLLCSGGVAAAGTSPVTHYTAQFYGEPNAGTLWTCQGDHITTYGGAAWEFQTCILTGDTSGIVAGTYQSDPALGLGTPTSSCPGAALGIVPFEFGGGPACWSSDYNGQFASRWWQTFIPNRNGTWTFFLLAQYAASS